MNFVLKGNRGSGSWSRIFLLVLTCPVGFGPCFVDDLDISSFAVVVGREANGALQGPDFVRGGAVNERHTMRSDKIGVDVDGEGLLLCHEFVLL